MMDDQAEYVAEIAAGKVRLPDAETMRQGIAADHEFAARQFPDSPRYGLELDPWRYRKLLAREYANNRVTLPPNMRPELEKTEAA
jgi:dimethylaniline monooxygenase (N-oxide forming)